MSAELYIDGRVDSPPDELDRPRPVERDRPTLSGDLPTVLDSAAPMFRRAVVGYDRFQVDTYVRWAEDELTTSDLEREHLLARHLRTREELEQARELLAHSAGAGDFLRVSDRIGTMLAAAADDAEAMRAEAQALRAEAESDRAAAAAHAMRIATEEGRVLADADAAASRTRARAAEDAAALEAAAARVLEEAEQTAAGLRAEADARLVELRELEQRAAERAERIRQHAEQDASAARLRARDDVVQMLVTAREERRRADEAAAATRERLDRDATERRAALLTEIDELRRGRAALAAELDRPAQVSAPADRAARSSTRVRVHRPSLRASARRLRTGVLPPSGA